MIFMTFLLIDALWLGVVLSNKIPQKISELLKRETDLSEPYRLPRYVTPPLDQALAAIGLLGLLGLVVFRLAQTLPDALNSAHVGGLYSGSGTFILTLVLAVLCSMFILSGSRKRIYNRYQLQRIEAFLGRKQHRATSAPEKQALQKIRDVLSEHRDELINPPPVMIKPDNYLADDVPYTGPHAGLKPVTDEHTAYLQPLVDMELAWGNELEQPFHGINKDGTNWCFLKYPLRIERLKQAFDLPDNVTCSADKTGTRVYRVQDGWPVEQIVGRSFQTKIE